MKYKKIVIILISLLLVVSFYVSVQTNVFAYELNIELGLTDNITGPINPTGARHYGFPNIVRAANGNLVLVYANGTTHSSASSLEYMISTDDAVTWSNPSVIEPHDGVRYAAPGMGIANDGYTIIIAYQSGSTNCEWAISTDNGSSWTLKGNLYANVRYAGQIITINGTTYATGTRMNVPYDPRAGDFGQYLLTLDADYNGWTEIWHYWNTSNHDIDPNEWAILNITNENFLSIGRDGVQMGPSGLQKNSTNAGVDWDWFWMRTDINTMHDPELTWINHEKRVIMLHHANWVYYNRTGAAYFSDDDGLTWKNLTIFAPYVIMSGPDAVGDAGYTGAAMYPEDNKAYVVWYWGIYGAHDTTNIYGRWVYDNTSYTPAEDEDTITSVDGGGNESFFRTGTPEIKWVLESNAIAYHLQIATNKNFSNIIADISDINEYNHPSDYSSNSTHATFTLPSEYRISDPDGYYTRVIGYR